MYNPPSSLLWARAGFAWSCTLAIDSVRWMLLAAPRGKCSVTPAAFSLTHTHTHTHLNPHWNVGRRGAGCQVEHGERGWMAQKGFHLSATFQNSIKNLLFSVRAHWKLWAKVCWLSMGQHDLPGRLTPQPPATSEHQPRPPYCTRPCLR